MIFGNRAALGKPPVGFGTPPFVEDTPGEMVKQAPARKRGLFGKGMFRNIAGTVGDYLLQDAGFEPIYAPSMLARRQAEASRMEAETRRNQDWEDYVRKQEYERANPKPASPNDTERDYQFILETAGPEAAKQWLQNRYDPIVNVPLPNGVYLGPRSGMTGTQPGRIPIGQPYRPQGGPTPPASGNFPR